MTPLQRDPRDSRDRHANSKKLICDYSCGFEAVFFNSVVGVFKKVVPKTVSLGVPLELQNHEPKDLPNPWSGLFEESDLPLQS